MKLGELRLTLLSLSDALTQLGKGKEAAVVRFFVDGIRPYEDIDVSRLKGIPSVVGSSADGSPGWLEFIEAVRPFASILDRVGKAGVRRDFYTLLRFGSDPTHMTIRSFLDSIHQAFSPDRPRARDGETLVDAYVRALQSAKHDEKRFPMIFAELINDKQIGKDDLVDIASKFAFKMSKSTTRKAALERIWKIHNASEGFAVKSRAIAGKSAA